MNKLEEIQKKVLKAKKEYDNFFKKQLEKTKAENIKRGLEEYNPSFVSWGTMETDDKFTKPKKVNFKNGLFVWKSNVWINSNKPPQNIEMMDERFPCAAVSYWYTPEIYNKRGIDAYKELEKKAEKVKTLYNDGEVKVCWEREFTIPFFHSCQYRHRMSKPRYTFYISINYKPELTQKILELYEQWKKEIITKDEYDKRIKKVRNKQYKWVKIASEKTINELFAEVRYHINDWYIYE